MTDIRYEIPGTGHVRIDVFDSRGRQVVRLLDEVVISGSHEVTWNGRDASGREVPSGVYLSRLEANGQVAHGRMTLVR